MVVNMLSGMAAQGARAEPEPEYDPDPDPDPQLLAYCK